MTTNEIEEIKTQEGIIKLLKANFDPSHGLDIHGMVQNKHLSKSILDASWGYFTNLLHYKLEMLGGRLVKINPYNTSQACSSCGEIVKKTLMTRTHSCMNCGYVADRDENAARNILYLGLDKANREGISVEGLANYKALMSMSAPSKKDFLRSNP